MDLDQNRRIKKRTNIKPRPLDLCSLGESVKFYDVKVVDESIGGLGCILGNKSCELPSVGDVLDWCGIKRFKVCWTSSQGDVARLGLRVA